MAVGHSLPPIDLPRKAAVQRKLRRAGGFGVGATAVWLCLMGMSASQPANVGMGKASAERISSCKLKQKKPLFVGFAEGMRLDSFESSALAARDIVHELKRWTCDETESASGAVSSLQLAFARHEPLRLDLVQFDDASMEHAHVLVGEARDARGEPRWRLDLSEQGAGWTIDQSRIATAEDVAEERASRRSK